MEGTEHVAGDVPRPEQPNETIQNPSPAPQDAPMAAVEAPTNVENPLPVTDSASDPPASAENQQPTSIVETSTQMPAAVAPPPAPASIAPESATAPEPEIAQQQQQQQPIDEPETDSDLNPAAASIPTEQPTTSVHPIKAPSPRPSPQEQKQQQSAIPAAKGRRGGGRSGLITLKLLIDEGFLHPGEDVLSVEYKGMAHTGTLLADGRIHTVINGKALTFDSPSAFSIYLKRLVNPTRKADDGWKTVKYNGKLLEHYKGELAKQKFGASGLEGGAEGGSSANLEGLERQAKRVRTNSALPFTLSSGSALQDQVFVPDRPHRVRRAPPRFAAIGADDEHALQPLEAYEAGQQPFEVYVSPAVDAMMDYHAHLSISEVIGILAGYWDPQEKKIKVVRAIPVKHLDTEDDSINVEMDPEDQIIKMEEVSKAGLHIVGWYHSHPAFPSQPSTIDIYNQVLQQHAHREESSEAVAGGVFEPYIAAIVSPYDHRTASSSPVSSMTWFYVEHASGKVPTEGQRPDEIGCKAKELLVKPLLEPLGQLENLGTFQREMEQVAKKYAPLPERANLEGKWIDGSLRLEKLVSSVQSRLPTDLLGDQKVKQFGSKLWVSTRAVWNVYGKPVAAPAAPPEVKAATVSAGVPHQGDVGSHGGDDDNGATNAHEADEPISDDEGTV